MVAGRLEATTLIDKAATKSNMHEAISKIVGDTGREDIAVITFSGHGTWLADEDGDEPDGRDEALCPYDMTEGQILTDDDLYAIFRERKRGARIIMISDSCHSGTVARARTVMPGAEQDPWNFQKIRYLAPESLPLKKTRRVCCEPGRWKTAWRAAKSGPPRFRCAAARMKRTAMTRGSTGAPMGPFPMWRYTR